VPAPPAVVYVFAEDRKGERATDLFAGFNGILQVDGYAGYNGLLDPARPRPVEPPHHGPEHQADACAQPRLSAFDTRLDRGLVFGNLPPAVIRNRSDDFQQT
jgi:Transposase IS66 family